MLSKNRIDIWNWYLLKIGVSDVKSTERAEPYVLGAEEMEQHI